MFDQLFANLATGFADQFGAPFIEAMATWPGTPVKDAGGSIVTPGTPVSLPCKAQFDEATQAMRATEGFLETDVRILVLSATLDATLDTKAKISVAAGANAGTWALLSCERDPAGVGYECRGRYAGAVVTSLPNDVGILDFSDETNSGLLALMLEDA